MSPCVYLDYAASTPIDPAVQDAMLAVWREGPANPHNTSHAPGRRAAAAIEDAREQVAAAIGGDPEGVFFTSGATESNNLAIAGAVHAGAHAHLVTAPTEHRAVLAPIQSLSAGRHVTMLGVDREGRLDLDELDRALRAGATFVTLMWANNEIGTVHDVASIGALTREHGAVFHCDATQAVGRVHVDVDAAGIDLLSLSGHKIYGPMGTGALWARPGIAVAPILLGGGQERGLRPGTANTAGVVGLGLACALAARRIKRSGRTNALTERLMAALAERLPGTHRISPADGVVAGILNVAFEGVETESLLSLLTDVAVSAGAACGGHGVAPSHVLTAIGVDPELLLSCVRFSLGDSSTDADVDRAAASVADGVSRLRSLAGEHGSLLGDVPVRASASEAPPHPRPNRTRPQESPR